MQDEFRRTFAFGKIAEYGQRKINAVEIEVALRKRTKAGGMTVDGVPCDSYLEFTASGTIWNGSRTDAVSCGQNLDEIAKHAGQLNDPKLFRRIYRLWLRWHLGGMHAGTREQSAALEEAHAEIVKAMEAKGYVFDRGFGRKDYGYKVDGGLYYYRYAGFDDQYAWACETLKRRGLYEVPFGPEVADANGVAVRVMYKYGSGWLIDPMPADVLEEVFNLFRMGAPEYAARFDAWLNDGKSGERCKSHLVANGRHFAHSLLSGMRSEGSPFEGFTNLFVSRPPVRQLVVEARKHR